MIKKLLILTLILISSSFAIAQSPLPIGVGGLITVDNIPIGGITVQVENRNTGEVRITTTDYDNPPYTKCGYYFETLTGQDGDTIKVTATYGNTYSNTTIVEDEFVTLDISISTEEPYEPPEEPPDDPPYNPPSNGRDEPDEPETPEDNETEEPPYEPPENDTDNDIRSLYNLTVEVVDNTTNNPVSNASVTIYNNNETKITKSYTNESGEAVFLLEEGIYIIEIEKNNHPISYHTVSLLASMEYTTYMSTNENSSSTPCPCQKGVFPVVYVGIIGAVIALTCIIIFFYRRRT